MGHHLDGKSSIVPLIDRLNKYPIGLPDSDKLRQILAIVFSEDEAYIASRFPLTEATLKELVRATGWESEKLSAKLDEMALKGMVFESKYGGKVYYLLMPGLIGFFELTFMKQRQDLPMSELARLMDEYLFDDPDKKMGKEFFGSRTPLTRALAYEEHIPVSSQIATYESAREIIKKAGYGAIGICYCRHKKGHLGESCDKDAPTKEICISLGTAAKFMVRREFAEKRSTDELLKILEGARDLNLTHVTDNIRYKPSFICNCCSCCCELLRGVQDGFPMGVAKTNYTLSINGETCVGCGLCKKACNVTGLERFEVERKKHKKQMRVIEDNCLGCGACISACPTTSLSLVSLDRPHVPGKKKDLMKQILKEKKRLTPFITETVKKKIKRKIGLD